MIENIQDSLRLVRHLMEFGVEEFAEEIGVTRQTVNNLETKKNKMSATQYETAFRDDSLLKRWFKDFLDHEEPDETFDELSDLAAEYKIFLDAKILTTDDATDFIANLTNALKYADEKVIVQLAAAVMRINEPDDYSEIVAGFVAGGTVKFYDAETSDDTAEDEPTTPGNPAVDLENTFDGWQEL